MNFIPVQVSNFLSRFSTPSNLATKDSSPTKDSGKRMSMDIKHPRTFMASMEQDELRSALLFAKDLKRPDRSNLLGIYEETMRDPHLLSQIRTNILKITGSPFAVFKEGTDEIDEEATKLLQKPWFNQMQYHFHETPYYGHTLIEFQQMKKPVRDHGAKLEFKKVKVFPRENVRPETHEILLDMTFEKGWDYTSDHVDNQWFLEMGESHNIGLLNIAARYVIWKNYSMTDWSRMIEKWGMPTLVIKTASSSDKEIAKKEKMAADFGSNLWVIMDDDDDVEAQWPRTSDGHKIYMDKADFCDAQMSKLISGQTGTSDEKAYVGSAEVHENILNEYMEQAMRNETYYNNDELFPFLIEHGYPLEGLEFRYLAFMKDEEDAEEEVEEETPPTKPPKDPPKKKPKAKANFTKPFPVAIGKGGVGTLTQRVEAVYHADCCHGDEESTLQGFETLGGFEASVDLDRAVNKATKRIYDRKLKAGGVDEELFWNWAADLWAATLKGYGVKLDKLKYGSGEHQLVNQLRYNIHVFAAFKNHHHTNELVKALITDDGKVRSFAKFKEAAGLINSKYNKNWLKTEHTQAILSGRNAQRWEKMQSRKHIFPNVEYVVVDDERLSQICADLKGGVWSIDDPVLKRIAPSNHWRCRSILTSSTKPLNNKATGEEIQPTFDNNPGITGEAMGAGHPYYDVQEQFEKQAETVFGMARRLPMSKEQLASNIKSLNDLDRKQYSEINTFARSGGWMAIHKLAHKSDIKLNKKMATTLAKKKGYAVEVRAHVEDGTPNPELSVNGILSDVKSPKTPYSLDSRLQKAVNKQGLNNVVYEVKGNPTLEALHQGLRRGLGNRKKIDWIDVVYKGIPARITREMFDRGVILVELEQAYK